MVFPNNGDTFQDMEAPQGYLEFIEDGKVWLFPSQGTKHDQEVEYYYQQAVKFRQLLSIFRTYAQGFECECDVDCECGEHHLCDRCMMLTTYRVTVGDESYDMETEAIEQAINGEGTLEMPDVIATLLQEYAKQIKGEE